MINSINGYTPISQNSSLASTKTENSENADLFKQILSKAVQGSKDEEKIKEIMQELGELGEMKRSRSTEMLSEISSISGVTLNNPLSEIESKADELLDKLTLYAENLQNDNVSLKDMDSLLEEINSSASNLLKDAEGEEYSDQELMDILSECRIVAQSEYIKLQRGDYLDSFA